MSVLESIADFPMWDFAIAASPIVMVALGSKLVDLRTETRARNSGKTAQRLKNWMLRGEGIRSRHLGIVRRFEDERDRGTLGSWSGVGHRMLAGFWATGLTYIRIRALPGRYLNYSLKERVEHDLAAINGIHERHKDEAVECKDKEAGRKAVREALGGLLSTFHRADGLWLLYGILATVLLMLIAWRLDNSALQSGQGPEDWYGWTKSIGGALCLVAVLLMRKNEHKMRSLLWGYAIATFLFLTSSGIVASSAILGVAFDLPRVSAVFICLSVLLTLCHFYDSEGALKDLTPLERRIAKRSYRLTLVSRLTGPVAHWRVGEWLTTVIIVSVYALAVVSFLLPGARDIWFEQDVAPAVGITPVLAITIGALAMPPVAMIRAAGSKRLGTLVGLLVMVALGWLGSTKESFKWVPEAPPHPPVTEAVLPGSDREAIEKVIEFELNSSAFDQTDSSRLSAKVGALARQSGVGVIIVGHADSSGEADYNEWLSKERAEAVLGYLVDAGLEADRFEIVSCGATVPVVAADGTLDPDASRRVEFMIQGTGRLVVTRYANGSEGGPRDDWTMAADTFVWLNAEDGQRVAPCV